jgi:hypothetical protein
MSTRPVGRLVGDARAVAIELDDVAVLASSTCSLRSGRT